ncbi:hypothetical protein LJ655_28715, partial [Paraburkholderia sp. MMS20-SJTN17]|nr:hypothetical protein [Paraburkholderia sp. MMS20-SJTN17]
MGSNPTRPTKVSKEGFRIPEPFRLLTKYPQSLATRRALSFNGRHAQETNTDAARTRDGHARG